ncbi:hypothetical protein [Alloyangia pacifica]|uniref:Uncharacterized protein n=1 Tax=Alloyangia pacifica TaxID=311180 RepID=A0A1I6PNS5_9RHOB|nr:hypothetical protein [Alloyangia pacifica]SDG32064.1 hypothetical protein SAMN04488245_102360 [Alloyangia pacifica]SFS41695.1 hypothetical protein SAMN04488050_101661 [Alloyangia pacifica]
MSTPSFLLPSHRTETVQGHKFLIRELMASDMAHISTLDPNERGYAIVQASVSMEGVDLGDPREWKAAIFQPLLRAALVANGMSANEEPEVGNAPPHPESKTG